MKKLPRVFPRKPRVAQPTNETAAFAAENPANLDNRAVSNFSNAMRVKLAAKRLEGRGGWQDKEHCSNEYLSQLLREHVEKGDPVDVANFAMMIHQRHESIAPSPAPKPVSLGAAFETVAEAYVRDEAKPAAGTHWTAFDVCNAFIAGAKFGRMRAANEFLASQSVQAPQNMTVWQTIATAPKNVKVLAAYQNELGNWRIVTACYHTQLDWSDEYGDHEAEFAPEAWYEENDSSEVIYPTTRAPTHWQPLPAPPALAASEGSAA